MHSPREARAGLWSVPGSSIALGPTIVDATNITHPCKLGVCTDKAVSFSICQANGIDVVCSLIFDTKLKLTAHINDTCVCESEFDPGGDGIVRIARIVGVIYRKIVRLVAPDTLLDCKFVEVNWTPLKLTTFVICLAMQTHGKDEGEQARSITTSFSKSTWSIQPRKLQLRFVFRRKFAELGDHTAVYPPGLVFGQTGFVCESSIPLGELTRLLWQTVVLELFP
jgi:hypothetical protein